MDVSDTNMGNLVHPTMGSQGWVTCDWYGTSSVQDLNGTGTVSISTWLCPDGFNLSDADPNALTASCATPLNGIDLSVESQNNYKQTKTVGQDAPGRAYFQFLKGDFLQITGSQEGYATPRVFCRGVLNGGTSQFETAEIPANNATFAYILIDGEELICDWYAVPAARAQVYINVHLCPSGPDLSQADMNTLASSCQLSMNGVAFTIVPAGQGGLTFLSGETADSGVLWQGIAPGKATISQNLSKGFAGRVFCDQVLPGDSGAAHYTERDIKGTAFSTKLDPGEELNCDWFNLNDGGANGTGGVTLNAFACPDGFDANGNDLATDLSTCGTPLNGASFTLAAQAGNLLGYTGNFQQGTVNFYDIPAQGAVVVAGPPDGYATTAVFCGQALDYDGQPNGFDQMPTYDTNSIQAAIDPGAQEVCQWFFSTGVENIATPQQDQPATDSGDNASDSGKADDGTTSDGQPADDGQADDTGSGDSGQTDNTGTVTVVNHLCPSGFDAVDADVNTLYDQCTGDGSGFLFTLTTEGAATGATTGSTPVRKPRSGPASRVTSSHWKRASQTATRPARHPAPRPPARAPTFRIGDSPESYRRRLTELRRLHRPELNQPRLPTQRGPGTSLGPLCLCVCINRMKRNPVQSLLFLPHR